MDPLSILASILTILGAGGVIAKGLRNIRQLKDVPHILHQLNNEVVDLHLLILAVDELFHEHSDFVRSSQRQIIYNILCRAKEALLDLEKLIAYRLTRKTDHGIESNRTGWVRTHAKIAKTHDRLRNARIDLNGAWTVISARNESQRVELKLQQILVNVDNLRQGQSENWNILNQTASHFMNQTQFFHELQSQQCLENTDSLRFRLNERRKNLYDTSPLHTGVINPLPPHPTRYFETVYFRMTRYSTCKQFCTCICHQKSLIKSPYASKRVIGSLFIGYSALPKLLDRCNMPTCQARLNTDFQFLYVFPSWLISGAVHMMMNVTKTKGPELILRYLRVQPRSSVFFQTILGGYSSHTMNLIANGLGSVLDVDENDSSSTLMVLDRILMERRDPASPFSDHFGVLRNLIREGADLFLENHFIETPYLSAWRCCLIESSPTPGCEIIDQIINTSNPSEILGCNELHSSIAGPRASRTGFEKQLRQVPRQMIDERDRTGRTALSWAAELGDLYLVEKLLAKGADPNIADCAGYIPLFYCASKPELFRSLLDAGTDVNHVCRRGYTIMAYLARLSDDPDLFELLWSYGANIHIPYPPDGYTLLHYALIYSHPQIVPWLLEKGADMEAYASDGTTPFIMAIERPECSNIARRLLDMSANYKVVDRFGEGLLHYVARRGDLEVIAMLQRVGLSGVDLNQKGHRRSYSLWDIDPDGKTALDIADSRRDNNEAWAKEHFEPPDPDPEVWFASFEALVDSVEAHNGIEQVGDFGGGHNGAREASGDSTHKGRENINAEKEHLPGLPGSYPYS